MRGIISTHKSRPIIITNYKSCKDFIFYCDERILIIQIKNLKTRVIIINSLIFINKFQKVFRFKLKEVCNTIIFYDKKFELIVISFIIESKYNV